MKERNATEVYFTLVILLHMTRLMPRHLTAFVDAPAPGGILWSCSTNRKAYGGHVIRHELTPPVIPG